MSNSKRHHYIPKFYLEGFSPQGIMWVFDREKNLYRSQTPINTFLETYYYAVEQNDGIYDTSLEEKMAEIESYAAPVIHHLDDGGELSLIDKYTLSVFVSLLKARVPENEKVIEELRSEMLKRLGPEVDRNPHPFEPLLPRPSFIPPDAKRVDALKLIQELELLASNPKEAHNDFLKTIIPSTIEMSDYLFQMQWLIAHASSDTSFVTSDNPFLIAPPEFYDPNSPTGIGIATPGATKIIPLSLKSCLFIFDKGEGAVHTQFDRDKIKEINLMIANGCMRYVISRDESLLRYLVKKTRIDVRKRCQKIQVVQ
jgi:hypothetical protein